MKPNSARSFPTPPRGVSDVDPDNQLRLVAVCLFVNEASCPIITADWIEYRHHAKLADIPGGIRACQDSTTHEHTHP